MPVTHEFFSQCAKRGASHRQSKSPAAPARLRSGCLSPSVTLFFGNFEHTPQNRGQNSGRTEQNDLHFEYLPFGWSHAQRMHSPFVWCADTQSCFPADKSVLMFSTEQSAEKSRKSEVTQGVSHFSTQRGVENSSFSVDFHPEPRNGTQCCTIIQLCFCYICPKHFFALKKLWQFYRL